MSALLKLNQILIAMILMATGISSVQAESMSVDEQRAAKEEIIKLVHDCAYYRDNLNAERYASLFSEDGKITVRGNLIEGRDAIRGLIEAYPSNYLSLHMMGTSQVRIIDANNATGEHYAEVYAHTPPEGENITRAVIVKGPVSIGKYVDSYVRTEDGWKISQRQFKRLFTVQE